MKRIALAIVAIGVLVTVVLQLASRPTSPSPALGAAKPDPGSEPVAGQSENTTPERREVARAVVIVIDKKTGETIPHVEFLAIPESSQLDSVARNEGSVLQCEGTVEVSELQSASRWLIHADGYVSVLLPTPSEPGEVALSRASTLQVRVADEHSNAVVGARVVVYPWHLPGRGVMDEVALGHGMPGSVAPTWVSVTDIRGQVQFDTLPNAPYKVEVDHEHFYAAPRSRRVVPGAHWVQVHMRPLYAVCFLPPPGSEIQSWRWDLPRSKLDLSPAVLLGKQAATLFLEQQFPSAAIYVGAPREGREDEELVVTCDTTLSEDQVANGSWGLTQLREGLVPVFLEARESVGAKRVTFAVRNPSGVLLDCELLVVSNEDKSFFENVSGEELDLPPGQYTVFPAIASDWMDEIIPHKSFDIPTDSPSQLSFDILLRDELRLVEVIPKYPSEVVHGPVHLTFSTPEESGCTVMNWKPGCGYRLQSLVTTGVVNLRLTSSWYQTVEQTVHVEANSELRIQVPMAVTLRDR